MDLIYDENENKVKAVLEAPPFNEKLIEERNLRLLTKTLSVQQKMEIYNSTT
jgi:hypothetical protein